MFTRTFRRRRRIRALILGLAVTAAAVVAVTAMAASAGAMVPAGPPPQMDALAAEQATPLAPIVEKFVESRPVPLVAEKFAKPEGTSLTSHPDESTRGVRGEPTAPPARRLFPVQADAPGSTGWNDVAIGGAIIGCLLLAGGVAIVVTRRRGELAPS